MELRAWNVKDMPRQSIELNFGELKSMKEDGGAAAPETDISMNK